MKKAFEHGDRMQWNRTEIGGSGERDPRGWRSIWNRSCLNWISRGEREGLGASRVVQTVKNLPAEETRGRSLSLHDPLKKETATPSSIIARRI